MSLPQELDHLKIPLDDIKTATNNFADNNFLGQGGFGWVYKGQLSLSTSSGKSITTVAVKRLDVKGGQGAHEFSMEIIMLSSYKHDNLVSLIGFTDEGDEKLLVYKLEDNGSLDKYLTSTNLTWEQRLRICLGAARGLEYLHCGDGGHRIIHRDIKSSNILLDANWEAKISDFGLSKFGPTNQQFTFLVTTAAGTFGYVDPLYVKTGVLTKESDVYSFGVVLFEVLCGRPAMIAEYEDERRFLSRLVELGYKKGELNKIIIPFLIDQMKPHSFKVLSEIAFQCLNDNRKLRPTMGSIVKELESALQYQVATQSMLEAKPAVRTQLWGCLKGGSPWLFQLERNQKLRKITVYYERYIQSLVFTAQNSYGASQSSQQYGGVGDPNKSIIYEFTLAADEELIGLSSTVGKNNGIKSICSLCFLTNKKKYEPLGEQASSYYHYTKTWDVGLFAGFYGRSGRYVDAIGCLLKATD